MDWPLNYHGQSTPAACKELLGNTTCWKCSCRVKWVEDHRACCVYSLGCYPYIELMIYLWSFKICVNAELTLHERREGEQFKWKQLGLFVKVLPVSPLTLTMKSIKSEYGMCRLYWQIWVVFAELFLYYSIDYWVNWWMAVWTLCLVHASYHHGRQSNFLVGKWK